MRKLKIKHSDPIDLTKWDAMLDKFDKELITPLVDAHIAWQQSNALVNHMECNYDAHDLGSGEAYTAVVNMLISTTGDKQKCMDLYVEQLSRGDLSPNNLIMRAMVFNQQKIASEIAQATMADFDERALPNDKSFEIISAGLRKLPKSAQVAMGAYLDTMGGPLIRYFDKLNFGEANPTAASALGGVNGRQLIRFEVVGTQKDLIKAHRKALNSLGKQLKPNQNNSNLKKFYAAIEVELTAYKADGGVIDDSKKVFRRVGALDKTVLKDIQAGSGRGTAWATNVRAAIRTVDDLDRIDQGAWQRLIGGELRVGIVIGLLQVYSMSKFIADFQNGMDVQKTEAFFRMSSGGVGVAGTFSNALGITLERLGVKAMAKIPGARQVLWSTLLKKGGSKVLGPIASVIWAVTDIWQGVKVRGQGNEGLSDLYFASAILGLGLAWGMLSLAAMGPIGWAIMLGMLIAFIWVNLTIDEQKDNKIQLFLTKCYFGMGEIGTGEKYPNANYELEQYELVYKQ